MSDLTFKTNGEETFRLPYTDGPVILGNKCPETKLEMTFTNDIEKTEKEIAVLQAKLELLKEIEVHKSQLEKEPVMMLMRQGNVDIVDYDHKTYYRIQYTDSFSGTYVWFERRRGDENIRQVRDVNQYGILEDYYQKEVVKQKEEYPYKVNKEEKINSNVIDEVVDKMIKEHKAKKLYNRLGNELDYGYEERDAIVELVENWLPEPQSYEGSQNVDTELLVDGFNHCLEQIKGMLR